MFKIHRDEAGVIFFEGKFVAGQTDAAEELLGGLAESAVLDFTELQYISSIGLGIVIATQKRLKENGAEIRIANASGHIRELFRITRFDEYVDIE